MRPCLKFLRREDGFTMGAVTVAALIATTSATVALAAASGDIQGSRNDLDQKAAYDAAQAGINDYAFHLNNDNGYWAKCDNVPNPNAVNLGGSTARRRAVPGNTGATYAIELLPATGQTQCQETDPVNSMLEDSGPMVGTFRIRATGYSGSEDRSIIATFRRRSFLDYVYFSQYETSDPATYGNPDTVTDAAANCEKWTREGRPPSDSTHPWCDTITWPDFDYVRGPFHTNDSITTCGSPTFGRSPSDVVEVAAPDPGWQKLAGWCGSGTPNFQGTYTTNAPVLTPPPTNQSIAKVADPADNGVYDGQVIFFINGANMQVYDDGVWTNGVPVPANGVIYVGNDPDLPCSTAYSPFTVTYYDETSGCGNAYVAASGGGYSKAVTIAAENDIIIYDSIVRAGASNGSIMGLIANNFVRVLHAYPTETIKPDGFTDCGDGSGGEIGLPNLTIDASIMAIQHSFIVDHYDCGTPQGTLTLHGSIAQKFRGPVGTFGGAGYQTGYNKDYNYDYRLRYLSPPYFLDPVQAAWRVQRETADFP